MNLQGLPLSLKKAVSNCPLIIGVAPNAWPRIVASWFFPKFKILCYRDRQDGDEIQNRGVDVFSLQKNHPHFDIETISASYILDSKPAKKYLSVQKDGFALLVYKNTPRLQKIVKKNGWKLIANPVERKAVYEDKREFKEIIEKIGLDAIPGENLPIEKLTKEKLLECQKKLGQKELVLQLAEVTYGGGSGTLFLDDPAGLKFFHQRVAEIREKLKSKKKKIKTVNVAPFLRGFSPSVSCCATRFGVLTSPLQTQIVDIAEVGSKKKNRSGNFCGHDWSFRHYPNSIQDQAGKIAKRFGEYLYQRGYRGIFGLDLLVEEKTQKVYPVECNPRYTDAFPMVSLLLMGKGLLPMDIFHILELLEIEYDLDLDRLNQKYKQALEGSQIILHNLLGEEVVNRGILKGGVYRLENNQLTFLRPGLTPFDFENKDEFLFTEGLAKKVGEKYTATGRICRLISKSGILANHDCLKPEAEQIIKLAYRRLNLIKKNGRAN